jgi:hypothetical protein
MVSARAGDGADVEIHGDSRRRKAYVADGDLKILRTDVL